MAQDIFLTDSGDFSFFTNTDFLEDSFTFNFHVAPTDSLLFDFHVLNRGVYVNDNSFKYNFYLYTPRYDKKLKTVSGKGFIHQNIKLRVSTEINTVRENWTMGCDLHTVMHSSIPNTRLESTIERMIKDSISDLLPKSTVTVTLLNTNYLDYHDSIEVVIINDEDVYYYVV